MIKVELDGVSDFSDIDVVAHINGNDIECMMTFNMGELSTEHRLEILSVLRKHLAGISTRELINKLPR